MSREILFRGFREDRNGNEKIFVNGEWKRGCWITGYLYPISVAENLCDDEFIHRVIPETIGQYTGLKDKNGRKIFEGDICYVDSEHPYCVINYDESTAKFIMIFDGSIEEFFDNIYGNEVEIIGNIHDNPEMVEGDENSVCVK